MKQRRIFWTHHVNMRLKGRYISRIAILDSVDRYEVIESYPKDKYFPSYLVRSKYEDFVFHILFAADVEDGNVRIVTAYFPNPDEWEDDLKRRRQLR